MKNLNLEQLRDLVGSSFGIAVNANDFFGYAVADMVIIHPLDLEWVLPIFEKYSFDGLNACMSFIAKQVPIQPRLTDKFKEATSEIEKLDPKVWSEY